MALPEKNRICAFCKYARPTAKPNTITCHNREVIYKRRRETYVKAGIRIKKETSEKFVWTLFQNATCEGFEEAEDAKRQLVSIKLRNEYRSWWHENTR